MLQKGTLRKKRMSQFKRCTQVSKNVHYSQPAQKLLIFYLQQFKGVYSQPPRKSELYTKLNFLKVLT